MAHEEAIFPRFPRFLHAHDTHFAWTVLIKKTFLPFDDRDDSSLGLNRRKVHVWQGGQNTTHGKAVPSSAADASFDDSTQAVVPASECDPNGFFWRTQ
jgi:hypothetical protein